MRAQSLESFQALFLKMLGVKLEVEFMKYAHRGVVMRRRDVLSAVHGSLQDLGDTLSPQIRNMPGSSAGTVVCFRVYLWLQ